jgi:PDZ domain/Carboxypeptidase regulatory-like domain
MSRWWLLSIPLGLALALALFVRWLNQPVEPPSPTAAVATQGPTPEPEAGQAFAPPVAAPAQGLGVATLAGTVVRDGQPVAEAEVVLRGAQTQRVRSGADGAWSVELTAPQELLISARSGALASELMGPVSLAAGEHKGGLVLTLLAGAALEGVVVDAHARTPVEGARVSTSAGTATTGPDGRFEAQALSAGRNWLTVEAPGYQARVEWLVLEGARPQRGLEIALVRGARIEGMVTRMGSPAVGVAVWAERSASSSDRPVPAVTDGQGKFTLEAAPGTLQLYAAAPGQGRVPGPVLQLAPGQAARADFELGEALQASGTVTLDGQPLAGASLTAHDAQTARANGSVTSGPEGAFRFSGLSQGRYLLSVRTVSGAWEAGPFEQTGDGSPWGVALVSGGVLSGQVKPAAAGVQVVWKRRSSLGEGSRTSTDEKGAFSFSGVPNEPVLVEAVGPGGAAAATAKPGDPLVLNLAAGAIKVVVSANGAPVTDFHLRAREAGSGTVREADVLSPQGTYRLEVPPGAWEIWVAARGFSHEGAPARASVSGADTELPIALKSGRRIKGTVRDAATSQPLAGVIVRGSRRWYGLYDADDGPSTATDAAGRYELPALLPNSALVIDQHGYVRQTVWPWQLARANPDAVDIALAPQTGKPDAPPLGEPYEGVGMQLAEQPGKIVVAQVFPQGPAEAAGVRPGDLLLAVNGTQAAPPIDQVVARIRGPAGSMVKLDLQRGAERLEAWTRRASIRP